MKHDIALFPVAKSFLGHSIAFLALTFGILQVITGFFLLGLISYNLEVQYSELIGIVFHGNLVGLLRLLHMLLANFVVVATILHFTKAISYSQVVNQTKFLIGVVGSAIFLLSLGVAFTGYVVVSGNMSYGAALVILNLASVIPFLGDEVVAGILASATVTSGSIRRFTVLHFLLAIVALAFVGIHVILLHRQSPSKTSVDISDNSETLALILAKDFAVTFLLVSFVFADSVKTLVHPDNWCSFSRLITPTHIEPEIYFLGTFSAIKLHNGKLSGALLVVILG